MKALIFIVCLCVIGLAEACCPAYWTQYSKSCYRFFGESDKKWQEAEAHCNLLSPTGQFAHLVSINSKEENAFVHALFREQGSKGWNEYWIGATDQNSEGRYEWTDGTAFDFTYWRPGEPNSSGEDCVEVYESDASWNDEGCGDKHPFVCEVPFQ